ncbi:hypothetical protein QO007_002670 [Enterococcus lactis]|nr:hypothetical protein [Enterococcus lactis]
MKKNDKDFLEDKFCTIVLPILLSIIVSIVYKLLVN